MCRVHITNSLKLLPNIHSKLLELFIRIKTIDSRTTSTHVKTFEDVYDMAVLSKVKNWVLVLYIIFLL